MGAMSDLDLCTSDYWNSLCHVAVLSVSQCKPVVNFTIPSLTDSSKGLMAD